MGADTTEEPPFPLTDADRYVLSITDEEYKKHDWLDLKDIIGESRAIASAAREECCLSRPQTPITFRFSSGSRQISADT